MVALVIVAVTLVPVLARMTAVRARRHRGSGETRSRLLKAEGQEAGPPLGLEERDRLERRGQEIAAIRAARHAVVRRRRLAVLVLLALCVVLLCLCAVFYLPWWFCLLPLVAVAVILTEGTVSAARARRFERSVRDAERSARRARSAARSASSVTAPVASRVSRAPRSSRSSRIPHVSHAGAGDLPDGSPERARVAAAAVDAEVPGNPAEGPQSRPIRSVRQVARAVPLTGQERRRVLADVTPSVPIPAAGGAPVSEGDAFPADRTGTGVPSSGKSGKHDGKHDESLSSDLSAILSRRNS